MPQGADPGISVLSDMKMKGDVQVPLEQREHADTNDICPVAVPYFPEGQPVFVDVVGQ